VAGRFVQVELKLSAISVYVPKTDINSAEYSCVPKTNNNNNNTSNNSSVIFVCVPKTNNNCPAIFVCVPKSSTNY
jgi:hypothetical protein